MLVWRNTEAATQERAGDASDLRYRLLIAVLESAGRSVVSDEPEAGGEAAPKEGEVAECA